MGKKLHLKTKEWKSNLIDNASKYFSYYFFTSNQTRPHTVYTLSKIYKKIS